MRILKSLMIVLGLVLATLTVAHPAYALSQQKWTNVCTNFLGLRSAPSPTNIEGAAYGMDNGNPKPMDCLKPAPVNWDGLLTATLARIKTFENSSGRYLQIVTKCSGLSPDYQDTFPKCSKVTGAIRNVTPKTLSHYSVDQLVAWVLANI
jgi:hypothetical protein